MVEHHRARRPFESCGDLPELGNALGCLKNVEIHAGEDDLRRQRFDRIGTGAQRATLVSSTSSTPHQLGIRFASSAAEPCNLIRMR